MVLLKHLGGLPNDRSLEVHNNTPVNVISDEQRVAAILAMFARVQGATTNGDSAQEPMEQSPALIGKTH
jgi:hypothetical protein